MDLGLACLRQLTAAAPYAGSADPPGYADLAAGEQSLGMTDDLDNSCYLSHVDTLNEMKKRKPP